MVRQYISYLSRCYVPLEVEKLNAVFKDDLTVDEAKTRLNAPRNSLGFFEEMNTERQKLARLKNFAVVVSTS